MKPPNLFHAFLIRNSLSNAFIAQGQPFFAGRPRNTFWKALEKVLEGLVKKGATVIIKQHLPETFLTQAQNIIREGSERNPRRLKKISAKAQ